MLTYGDLLTKQSDTDRIEFIQQAIREHINTNEYRIAAKAMAYYQGENPDIASFEKYVSFLRAFRNFDRAGKYILCSAFDRKIVGIDFRSIENE